MCHFDERSEEKSLKYFREIIAWAWVRTTRGCSLAGGRDFLLLAQKKVTKENGSPAAETTPVDELRNRQGEQRVGLPNRRSLRSNSSPLFPVAEPAARLSGNGVETSCDPRRFRHCERSEAIHAVEKIKEKWIAASLRASQ